MFHLIYIFFSPNKLRIFLSLLRLGLRFPFFFSGGGATKKSNLGIVVTIQFQIWHPILAGLPFKSKQPYTCLVKLVNIESVVVWKMCSAIQKEKNPRRTEGARRFNFGNMFTTILFILTHFLVYLGFSSFILFYLGQFVLDLAICCDQMNVVSMFHTYCVLYFSCS